jgi:hypothetical protein
MGKGLAVLINGRDTGYQIDPPTRPTCGKPMDFEDDRAKTVVGLEGDTALSRAYYVCPRRGGQTLSPLDQTLRLRHDHWSEGAARVAARQGLQARSFDQAAVAFRDALGREMSGDSVVRITQEFARTVQRQRTSDVAVATAPAQRDEAPDQRRLPEQHRIEGQANLSTDGAMVLIRAEGGKEVKLVAISAVTVKDAGERAVKQGRPSRRAQDPLVELRDHSYQVGLWDAATLSGQQYAEGLRRGIDRCATLSSVTDATVWIGRATATNFPEVAQIIDWSHAEERLWAVGRTVFGEGTARSASWTQLRLDELWRGATMAVIGALEQLDLTWERYPVAVQQAAGYFGNNQGRMDYPRYRAAGYPIGSGTVESAANTVVHHRMKRPGRGWKRTNAEAMLAALSELHSGRFTATWQAILRKVA